jgi:hypothetical protein
VKELGRTTDRYSIPELVVAGAKLGFRIGGIKLEEKKIIKLSLRSLGSHSSQNAISDLFSGKF